jgi:RNA polymerase sigma factor (sigma-70 family)
MDANAPDLLLERIRRGDTAAFDELYLATYAGLRRFAEIQLGSRDGAEEVVHDVFLSLWERRAKLEITTSVPGYLYGAVRLKALERVRHEKMAHTATPKVIESSEGHWRGISPQNPESSAILNEIKAELREAVKDLPPTTRLAISLRWNQGLDYPAIGEALGISADAARMQVSRAQVALRKVLRRRIGD